MNDHQVANLTTKTISTYAWLLCFIFAYISSFFLSGISAPGPDLDPSYQAVLEYAKAHNFQFGVDIIFTYGPLGFLNTTASQGLFPVQRILFALAWSGIVALSVTRLSHQIPGAMKYVFLAWFLIYSNIGLLEQHAYLVMAYGCMILMSDVQKRKVAATIFLIVLALLSLIKFTFFMAATTSVILCSLVQIGNRNFKTSFAITTFFGTTLIIIWLAANQQLVNFFPWIRGSLEIVGGYTEAMTIFPKASVFILSAAAGAMFLISLCVTMQSIRLSFSSYGIIVATLVYVFLSWKHGFVRADEHTMVFIFFLPLSFSIILTEQIQKNMQRKQQRYLAILFIGVVYLCNLAADFQDPGTMLTKLIYWPQNMIEKSRGILNAVSGNFENCFEARQINQKKKLRTPDLTIARSLIGKASVDVFGYTQWAALANNLNYLPRPIIQGYSVYTPYLQNLNLSYYQSENRPKYILFRIESIDVRYPTLDDATILPFILSNYKLIGEDGGFLILQESPNISSNIRLKLVSEQTITFGETLDISALKNNMVIIQVKVKPTIIGKITKFLFQSPIITMDVMNNGVIRSSRFIPAMAERGFVLSPIMYTNNDAKKYFMDTTNEYVESICFSKANIKWRQLSDSINIKIYIIASVTE